MTGVTCDACRSKHFYSKRFLFACHENDFKRSKPKRHVFIDGNLNLTSLVLLNITIKWTEAMKGVFKELDMHNKLPKSGRLFQTLSQNA